MKTCACRIRHALLGEERTRASKALNYARRVGDRFGVMLAILQLAPCPDQQERADPQQEDSK
jgi:hypothetical protein